jgi:hypothetical protein
MPKSLSSNAIIYAILSINSEITLQKKYLNSPDVSPEEHDNEAGILEDLEQAFMEFLESYKSYRHADKTLPDITELLTTEL